MRILAICNSLDLAVGHGCTPAWWQFLKGFYEEGAEVIATAMFGKIFDTPWWKKASEDPVWLTNVYPQFMASLPSSIKLPTNKISLSTQRKPRVGLKTPFYKIAQVRWRKYLLRVINQDGPFDVMINFNIAPAILSSAISAISKKYGTKIVFYDGDAPVSLPKYWSPLRHPTNIYADADLTQYDGVITNSAGIERDLFELGAKKVEPVMWGVDPSIFTPIKIKKEHDIFFNGHGAQHREKWINLMISDPSRKLPNTRFIVGGKMDIALGKAKKLGKINLSSWRVLCCSSKINLNITRDHHAKVFSSSTSRPFELAMFGCCIVSNPVNGMNEWFKPEKEFFVVHTPNEVMKIYDYLLGSPEVRKKVGDAARSRALRDHTHRNRAKQILAFLRSI